MSPVFPGALDYTFRLYRYDSDLNFIDELILRDGTAPDYDLTKNGDIYQDTIQYDILEGQSLLLYAAVTGLSTLRATTNNVIPVIVVNLFIVITSLHLFFNFYKKQIMCHNVVA